MKFSVGLRLCFVCLSKIFPEIPEEFHISDPHPTPVFRPVFPRKRGLTICPQRRHVTDVTSKRAIRKEPYRVILPDSTLVTGCFQTPQS